MTRWLVTGAGGMLGRDLVDRLIADGADIVALDRRALDVADRTAVRDTIADAKPDVVVNCAAYTRVDDAEAEEDLATRINGDGARHVAEACAAAGARMVQLSTDYVFAGDARTPYAENTPPGPISAYGRSKLASERAVLEVLPETGYVVRTAWLYGVHGPNFVATMIRLETERPGVDVVDDQRGQPTWTQDVAKRIIDLIAADAPPGIYHATSSGETTWYELAREIFIALGADPDRVRPTSTDRFPRPAPRPAYSVLGHDRWAAAGLKPIRPWRAALAQAFPVIRDHVLSD